MSICPCPTTLLCRHWYTPAAVLICFRSLKYRTVNVLVVVGLLFVIYLCWYVSIPGQRGWTGLGCLGAGWCSGLYCHNLPYNWTLFWKKDMEEVLSVLIFLAWALCTGCYQEQGGWSPVWLAYVFMTCICRYKLEFSFPAVEKASQNFPILERWLQGLLQHR